MAMVNQVRLVNRSLACRITGGRSLRRAGALPWSALAFVALLFVLPAQGQPRAETRERALVDQENGKTGTPRRPVHTFSIVARDPTTGELGVAVQSHWFSVGPMVPWVEAGVGAVATQSFVDPNYGRLGLELMRAGRSAPDALKSLLAGDDGRAVRQVAMIDAEGRVAAHTGSKNIPEAGHITGKDFSVQANLMLTSQV